MDETKRFLRYVVPGFIMFSEFIVFLFGSLLQSGFPIDRLSHFIGNSGIQIFSGVLVFTGIGAILSNFYHTIFSLLPIGLNYGELFRIFKESKLIIVKDPICDNIIQLNSITKHGRWRIVDALWHSNKITSGVLKENVKRTEALCDLAHSLGTSFVGSLFAYICWSYAYMYIKHEIPSAFFIVVFYVIILFHYIAARTVSESAQSVVSQILIHELKHNKNIPRELFITRLERSVVSLRFKIAGFVAIIAFIILFYYIIRIIDIKLRIG